MDREVHNNSNQSGLLSRLELLIPPPLYAIGLASLMWLAYHLYPIAVWIPAAWSQTGMVLMGVALLPAIAAFRLFRRFHTTANPHHPEKSKRLVTGGIYAYTRNPMYLSLSGVLFGWALYLGNLSALIFPPLFLLIIARLQIVPEEKALEAHFGEVYRHYKDKVRRWL